MWFELWSNYSNIPVIISLSVHHTFPILFLTNSHYLTGPPDDQQRTHQNIELFIVTVEFFS